MNFNLCQTIVIESALLLSHFINYFIYSLLSPFSIAVLFSDLKATILGAPGRLSQLSI